jgi:hypothetical protein
LKGTPGHGFWGEPRERRGFHRPTRVWGQPTPNRAPKPSCRYGRCGRAGPFQSPENLAPRRLLCCRKSLRCEKHCAALRYCAAKRHTALRKCTVPLRHTKRATRKPTQRRRRWTSRAHDDTSKRPATARASHVLTPPPASSRVEQPSNSRQTVVVEQSSNSSRTAVEQP